jgi:hypothetical protein
MGLSFSRIKETRNEAAPAAAAHRWISIALLLSFSLAACEEGEQQAGNLNSTGGLDAAADSAILLPPGTGGGTLGGAVWPIGNDAAVGLLPDSSVAAPTTRPCNRDVLGVMIDRLFLALKAHDTSSMPFAPAVKFTENGRVLKLGEGIW